MGRMDGKSGKSTGGTYDAPWRDVVLRKRELREAAISVFDNPTEVKSGVTEFDDAARLLGLYASGETTVEAVINAYIQTAIEAHKKTNCLTEILFERAVIQARELDRLFSATGKLVGPLHGVPVSIKDQCDVQGFDSTLGYVGKAFRPAQSNSVLVTMLQQLGAVIMCKTNLPQTILWSETENPLFGLTTHPLDRGYTPGGSSGGEASLLAMNGSLLGWGTDIGGSIRMPAHMTGIYGFKPTSARLPYRGVQVSTDGQEHVPSAVGPMARSLDTVHLAMKSLCNAQPWQYDARCAIAPWRDERLDDVAHRTLNLALIVDDGLVKPHPPILRMMHKVAEELRKAGHRVVDWDTGSHREAVDIMDEYFIIDGGEDIRRAVDAGGEPYIPRAEWLVSQRESASIYEYWQLNKRKHAIQNEYLEKWRSLTFPSPSGDHQQLPLDAIIMPVMPHVAVPHNSSHWVGYTNVWNLLDYPALVIPAGNIRDFDSLDVLDGIEVATDGQSLLDTSRAPQDALNSAVWRERAEEMRALNLPLGMQIIGQKMEDEKVIGVGKVLDTLVRTGMLTCPAKT